MRIYFAGVSRIVELEAWLVQKKAARLLSFYYEIENKSGTKGTKAFRVWKALKKGKFDIKKLEGLFQEGATKRKGIEGTRIFRDQTLNRHTGLFSVLNEETTDGAKSKEGKKGRVKLNRSNEKLDSTRRSKQGK